MKALFVFLLLSSSILHLSAQCDANNETRKDIELKIIEILDVDSAGAMSGAGCLAKLICGEFVNVIVDINLFYNNVDSFFMYMVFDESNLMYVYNEQGYHCYEGRFYEHPQKLIKRDSLLFTDIFNSYNIWLQIRDIKGLEYLQKKEISPLFLTNYTVKKIKTSWYFSISTEFK